MLVLARKVNDVIVIGQNIEIEVLEIRGQTVRIGIKAPREIPVVRAELIPQLVFDQETCCSGEYYDPVHEPLLIPTVENTSEQCLHHFCERLGDGRLPDIL